MSSTEIKYIECRDCDGTGEIDPTDHLDLNSIEAVTKELASVVTGDPAYGLRSANRAERIHHLARAGFLASRAVWLEALAQHSEDVAERFVQATEDLDLIKDLPYDMPWSDARKILAERKAQNTTTT